MMVAVEMDKRQEISKQPVAIKQVVDIKSKNSSGTNR